MYRKEANWKRVDCVHQTRGQGQGQGQGQVAGCGEQNDPLGFIICHEFLD
jgi:hypothetical protein